MDYKTGDRIEYFFKGDEDNEPCHDVMIVKELQDLDNEEVFKLTASSTNKAVWIKEDYDRSSKKYWTTKATDMNTNTLKAGNTLVFTGFIY
tara:strand:+ start:2791 stop:3063 length:273 start_codon:yes stop_codon:yes gene_type:complete